MGGQLADHGTIRLAGGGVVEVHDVQAPIRGLSVHRGTLTEGGITVAEKAYAEIDGQRRLAIARAHTATHMVYAGLRNVVSEDATQAGSENSPSRLRFDFRHGSALEGSQLTDIEALVNEKLAEDLAVTTEVMSIDAARKAGAIALFGEKYGSEVRVVTIGDGFDRELCGGTHVPTTGHIGRVTVLSEGSVGSGVRRIDALVGDGAYEFQAKEHALVNQLSQLVGGRADELPERIESLLAKLRDSEKELEKIRMAQALSQGADLAASAQAVGPVTLVAAAVVLITHDLGVVAGTADDIMVMYAGRGVERASVDTLFAEPRHPYTMGLLGAVPKPHLQAEHRLVPIKGNPPSLAAIPTGCPFNPRCPMATEECSKKEPVLLPANAAEGHLASCHHLQEICEKNLTYAEVYPDFEPILPKWVDVPRNERPVVLKVENLTKTFPVQGKGFIRRSKGTMTAVDRASFEIHEGETLALVGESGSGKSTTLMQIMDLLKPEDGRITVLGKDVAELKNAAQRRELRKDLQVIFQDPMSSLDPRMPVYDVLAEPLQAQGWNKEDINTRIGELMRLVGINPDYVDRFPSQFSGGQRQRIAIARALATSPKILLLDEPIASLDVSIQAGIINLLEDLQVQLKISYLFVAHDLAVIRHISDTVAVMHLGKIVEYGETEDVFTNPQDPYTKALLSAIPIPDPKIERTRERMIYQDGKLVPATHISNE